MHTGTTSPIHHRRAAPYPGRDRRLHFTAERHRHRLQGDLQRGEQGRADRVMGSAQSENIQGETQKKLDVITNDIFIRSNEWAGHLAAWRRKKWTMFTPSRAIPQGQVTCCVRSLDGSSNVDVNISVGTIFSILRCPDGVTEPTAKDFLQPGTKQVCAGYALYGSRPCWC